MQMPSNSPPAYKTANLDRYVVNLLKRIKTNWIGMHSKYHTLIDIYFVLLLANIGYLAFA